LAEVAENCPNSAMGSTWGGGGQTQLASLITFSGGKCDGGGGGGGRESKFVLVLDAACMHVALHYVSLSHISVLL
jgi:hypothetical protein